MVKDYANNIFLQNKYIRETECNLYICDYCFIRNFDGLKIDIIKYNTIIKIVKAVDKECEICENIFEKSIKNISNEIINSEYFTKNKPQTSIDIGTHIPVKLFDREDLLRSLFKIKGLPNIKNQYNHLIREHIIKKTDYQLDHLNPDIKIEIVFDDRLNFEINYKTRDIFLLGRYNKYKRSFNQRYKAKVTTDCNKIEDRNSNFENYKNNTVESIILQYLYSQFGTKSIKISWSGSEDENSLVLGNGRPFIVKVCNPSKRYFNGKYEIKNLITLNFQEIKFNDIHNYSKYEIKTKICIKILEGKVEEIDLQKAVSQLTREIHFYNKKKIIKKKIYSALFKLLDDKNFELVLILDNGIPIKQLIGGEEFIEPCLSKIINRKCECTYFDIYDINLKKY